MNKCPVNLLTCKYCIFEKEGLCDYPYNKYMSPSRIKITTQKLKEQRNGVQDKAAAKI